MIALVVVFLVDGVPFATFRATKGVATMAACVAFAEADEPRLMMIAAQVGQEVGRNVIFAASCIDPRPVA